MTYRHTTHMHGDYLDGDLSPEQKNAVERHVSTCETCRDDLEQLKHLTSALRTIDVPDPGHEYFDNVTEIILARTASGTEQNPSPANFAYRSIPGRQILKTLIRLAATITLLFAAFYVSDFHQERHASPWADDIKSSHYAVSDSLAVEERFMQPPVGINTLLGMPSPIDESPDRQPELPPTDRKSE